MSASFLWNIGSAILIILGPFFCEAFAPNVMYQQYIHELNMRSKTTKTALFVFSGLEEKMASSQRRTSNSTSTVDNTRGYCPRCKRPNVVCICHSLPDAPIDCGTRILILQHPREAKKRKRTSTVPLIGLSVRNVEICVGAKFGPGSHPLLDEALAVANSDQPESHALLLYPSEEAVPLQNYLESSPLNSASKQESFLTTEFEHDNLPSSNSHILVVVDGTWAQTQSMMQNSYTTLRQLPFVMFDETTNSLFDSLRQEPAPHCTSTLEAISRAIRLMGSFSNHKIKSIKAADALETSLQAMVDGQLMFALDETAAKPRYYRRNKEDEQPISKRAQGRTRKLVSRRRTAELSLPKGKSKEEIEMDRIRFIYVAHMG